MALSIQHFYCIHCLRGVVLLSRGFITAQWRLAYEEVTEYKLTDEYEPLTPY